MCSRTWEIPVAPGRSFREPTRYSVQTVTTGAARSSLVRTLRPFGRIVSRMAEESAVPAATAKGSARATHTMRPTVTRRRSLVIPLPYGDSNVGATLNEQAGRVKAISLLGMGDRAFRGAGMCQPSRFWKRSAERVSTARPKTKQRHGLGPEDFKADTLQEDPTDDDQKVAQGDKVGKVLHWLGHAGDRER